MNPKHTLKEYADALTRAGLLTATTLTPAAENAVIDCLSYDTRSLHGTSLFLCKGAHFKAEYLSAALAQGAAAYVAEKPYPVDAPQLLVSDIRYAMVVLGQLFYDHVTDKLTSVGITGTKGKSTTAYYVRSILNDWLTSEGKPPCAILSSIDNYDGVITEESHITTPEVLELYQHFQNAYDSGISHLVMEVSSQALKVGRVRGMTFDVGAFLNIGTDHISPIEHPDFADYYASKLKLFDSCRVGCVNTDADGCVNLADNPGLIKLAVVERHHATGHVGVTLLDPAYGLRNGAVATSVSHDSHNIVVAGDSEADMRLAVETVDKLHGGIVMVSRGEVLDSLPLPVAGLMSDRMPEEAADGIRRLTALAYEHFGITKDSDAFMTLSFLALPVIPHLKLTSLGLFDVDAFKFVDSDI